MAERPITPPRRDDLALAGDVFSQRAIVYLEDIAELTNDAPQDIEDETLAALGGINNVNILSGQMNAALNALEDGNQLIASLSSMNDYLLSENKQLKNKIRDLENHIAGLKSSTGHLLSINEKLKIEINDLNQLQTGGFNGG